MKKQNRFWIGLLLITAVCFIDYQLFTEGYSVRKIAPIIRQAGHLVVFMLVIPIGWWAWSNHPMQWLKKLWLYSYSIVLAFIVIVTLLKILTGVFNEGFLEWVTTVRYFFSSPMPFLLFYMLSRIAGSDR